MVAALVKPGEAILETLTPLKVRLIHAAMGIAGEIGEIVDASGDEHFLEESGDILFFCRELRKQADIHPYAGKQHDLYPAPTSTLSTLDVTFQSGEIVDVVKRIAVYNKPYSEEMKARLTAALDSLESWVEGNLERRGMSRAKALEHNLNKLLKGPNARYASGTYSDAQAHARSDKTDERTEALRIVWYALGMRTLFDSLSLEGVLASDADVIEAASIFAEDEDAEYESIQDLLIKNRSILGLTEHTIKLAYP